MSNNLPSFIRTSPPPIHPLPTETRLQALYASTSTQRVSNPTGCAANVSWWTTVLINLLRSGYLNGPDGDHLVLSLTEGLLEKFDWGGSRPKGLGGVVETQALKTPPSLFPLPQFLTSTTPLHAPPSFTRQYLGRPLWWAVSQLNPFGGSTSSGPSEVSEDLLWKRWGKGREYVVMSLLEQSASLFIQYITDNPPLSYSSSLYDTVSFRETFGRICLPKEDQDDSLDKEQRLSLHDCEVLIKWLSRDEGVIVSDGTLLKILSPDESPLAHPISEADHGTLNILKTLSKLTSQIQSIETQISVCQSKAKKALSQGSGSKNLAISYLRSRKALEELLEKRVVVAGQLGEVVLKIDQAKGDVEIMTAYELSTTTLSTILNNPKLQADYIATTTDNLAETLANAKEIDDAIQDGGKVAVGAVDSGDDVDEEELGRELEELVREETESQEREKQKQEKEKVNQRERERERERGNEEENEFKSGIRTEVISGSGQPQTTPTPTPQSTMINTATSEGQSKVVVSAEEAAWQKRYEAAQQREKDEKARAEVERMKRDAQRVAAE